MRVAERETFVFLRAKGNKRKKNKVNKRIQGPFEGQGFDAHKRYLGKTLLQTFSSLHSCIAGTNGLDGALERKEKSTD